MDIGYVEKVEGYLWVDEECVLNEVCLECVWRIEIEFWLLFVFDFLDPVNLKDMLIWEWV